MNMKRTMAAVLSAAMLLSGGLSAMAANNTPVSGAPGASAEQTMPSTLSGTMTVLEVSDAQSAHPYLLVKENLPEGSKETAQEIRLNFGDETVCIDATTGTAADLGAIKKGDVISATYSTAMTRSIPPQSFCYAVAINLGEKNTAPHFLVAEQVTKNDDGSVTVLTSNGTLFVTLGKDTPVTPYKTKNIVKNTDMEIGTNFFAWYDVVALSMPGQTHATRATILPQEYASVEPLSAREGDEQQPLQPGETTPYRYGTQATVVDVTTETIDGDMVVVRSYTLKSEDETRGTFVANVGESTLLVDNTTGEPVNDVLKKDDKVYVYFGSTMTASEPAQVSAELILVNLGDKSPARLLTAEQTEQNVDGTVRLLGDNKGIWVTVGKDTPVSALKTKNVVKNTDIRTGTSVLAWYDFVAESMPAQATANKVVVLPHVNSTFTIITGGDIAIAEGKVENGVAMVPMRAVAEALGFTVTWNAADKSIGLKNDKVQTTVTLGEDLYYYASAIEGMAGMSKPSPLGAAAYEQDGTSYVPAELFNLLGASATLTGSVMHL